MDINKILRELKARPGFAENVGMTLIHNGTVRGWSRADHAAVEAIDIAVDRARLEAIRREMERRPGIFAVEIEAREGRLAPGDDVLLLVVAGDIRENVKATLAELLDRVKAEAVSKKEHGPAA